MSNKIIILILVAIITNGCTNMGLDVANPSDSIDFGRYAGEWESPANKMVISDDSIYIDNNVIAVDSIDMPTFDTLYVYAGYTKTTVVLIADRAVTAQACDILVPTICNTRKHYTKVGE